MSTPVDSPDFFSPPLKSLINLDHEVVRLAARIDWLRLEKAILPSFRKRGEVTISMRFMLGLLLLKSIEDISDEQVCEQWVQNPYYQFITGEEFFSHKFPYDRHSFTRWRQILGKEAEAILIESLHVAYTAGAMAAKDYETITIFSPPLPPQKETGLAVSPIIKAKANMMMIAIRSQHAIIYQKILGFSRIITQIFLPNLSLGLRLKLKRAGDKSITLIHQIQQIAIHSGRRWRKWAQMVGQTMRAKLPNRLSLSLPNISVHDYWRLRFRQAQPNLGQNHKISMEHGVNNQEIHQTYPEETSPSPPIIINGDPTTDGIWVDQLGKNYKARSVLKNVSLHVQRGEVVGLLGPNGAGKTTCFYIISGLLTADRGRIVLDGEEITNLPMYRRARLGIGYLPQEPSIFRGLTVAENILAILETLIPDRRTRSQELEQLLEEFSITHLRDSPSMALSGGERRRLEIARALASHPHFILLDEPLAGVDPIAVRDIRNLVYHLKGRGIGVLITDHNVRDTLGIVDRAYILHDGVVITSGTPEQIIQNPDARRVYLGDNFTLNDLPPKPI